MEGKRSQKEGETSSRIRNRRLKEASVEGSALSGRMRRRQLVPNKQGFDQEHPAPICRSHVPG